MFRVTWPIFNFHTRNHIFGTSEVTVAKFCVQVEYIKCSSFGMTDAQTGVVRLKNFAPVKTLESAKLGTSNFVC